ncbi:ranaspumin-like [Bufo gargarizans]|uniref:ranaspumin-like n=1 Tax=Bufo gargarizans TaxID=30331 RepID=UPI001CF24D38|nr:ranaspumin-like [Bufo gargarizans]
MKIIFFLVLAGLSVSHGYDCIQRYQAANTLQCLKNALEIAPDFLEKLIYFLCNYKDGMKNNKREFEAAFRDLIEIVECGGCALDKITGTNESIEELLGDIGGAGQQAVFGILKAADGLQLTGPVAHLACSLLKGLGTPGGLVNLSGILGNLGGGLGGILG